MNLFIKFCIDIFRKRKLGAGSLTGVRFPALLVFACRKEESGEIFIWNNFDTSCCFRMESSIALQTTEGKEDKLLDEVKISVINIGDNIPVNTKCHSDDRREEDELLRTLSEKSR